MMQGAISAQMTEQKALAFVMQKRKNDHMYCIRGWQHGGIQEGFSETAVVSVLMTVCGITYGGHWRGVHDSYSK